MKKYLKCLVSLLIAVFVMSSISIIASASSIVDSGTVNNSYRPYGLGEFNYSYTWKYYDNDTLIILPSTSNLYINVNDLTDYMKTRLTSNTKITIDCSLEINLKIFGQECPASNFTFVGTDLNFLDFYDFSALNSVNIDIDFAPTEYPHIFNNVNIDLYRCGITTADIFEGNMHSIDLDFHDCNNITSLTVPEYVSYLYVFRCKNLEFIQATNNLKSLLVVETNSLKNIYVYGNIQYEFAVDKAPNLETIEVTGTVWKTVLQNVPFSDFTIPNNGGLYLINSNSLTRAAIEPGRTEINLKMFEDCINLADVTMPEGVTEINYRAFGNCSSLKSIVIPSSVIYINEDAFDGCSSLTDVFFTGNYEQWENIVVRSGIDFDLVTTDKSINEIFGNATLHFPDPEIITQPEDCAGTSGSIAEFTVEAEGSRLKYQWQVLKNGTWTNCSINDGAKTATLSLEIKSSRDGSKYRCVITDKFNKSITTDEVTLTIENPLIITDQPSDYSGDIGEYAVFNVVAQGDGLKYQWQYLKNGTWTNCSLNDGARTATFTQEIKDSRNGNVYHCVITDKNGKTVTSSEVTLTVDKSLRIVEQPVGGQKFIDCPVGFSIMFTVAAEGDGLKYQWQVLKNGTWTNCSINDGAKSDYFKVLMKESRDGCVYRCVVSDKYGNTEYTNEVTVTLFKGIVVTFTPEDCYANLGETACFSLGAAGTDIKYQWQVLKNGTWTNCSKNDGAKTNTLSLKVKESRDGSQYRCVVTDKYENVYISETVTLYIIDNSLPAKAVQVPADSTVIEAEDSVAAEEVVETVDVVDTVDSVETVDIVETVEEVVSEASEVFEVAEVIETEAVTEAD